MPLDRFISDNADRSNVSTKAVTDAAHLSASMWGGVSGASGEGLSTKDYVITAGAIGLGAAAVVGGLALRNPEAAATVLKVARDVFSFAGETKSAEGVWSDGLRLGEQNKSFGAWNDGARVLNETGLKVNRLGEQLLNAGDRASADETFLQGSAFTAKAALLRVDPSLSLGELDQKVSEMRLVPADAERARFMPEAGSVQFDVAAHSYRIDAGKPLTTLDGEFFGRARSYAMLGHDDLALADYTSAIAHAEPLRPVSGLDHPYQADAYLERGGLQSRLGDAQAAEADYQQGSRALSEYYAKRQNADLPLADAPSMVDTLRALPSKAMTRDELNNSLFQVHDSTARILDPSIDSDTAARAFQTRAQAYENLGHDDLALRDYDDAISRARYGLSRPFLASLLQSRSEVHFGLGNLNASIADVTESADIYAQSRGLDVGTAARYMNHISLGNAIMSGGRSPEAMISALENRAVAYEELGHVSLAARDRGLLVKHQNDLRNYYWTRNLAESGTSNPLLARLLDEKVSLLGQQLGM